MSLELVSAQAVEEHYDFLNTCGFLGKDKGYLRPAYSDLETEAMVHFKEWSEPQGAIAEWDALRNLTLTFNQDSKTPDCYVEFISHLDTVPNGGNFDGAAGIVAAILAAQRLTKNKMLPKGVAVREKIVRGEESGTYGVAYLGSLGSYGLLDPAHLDKSFGGQLLRDAMIAQGVDITYIEQRRPTIGLDELDKILFSDELHIEQGPILHGSNIDIGVVTSIRGAIRLNVEYTGESAHSGTTPLNLRKDANIALALGALEVDSFLKDQLQNYSPDLDPTNDLICTVTEIKGGSGLSSVSGSSNMRIDIRGVSPEYLDKCVCILTGRLKKLASDLNVICKITEVSRTEPIPSLDKRLQSAKFDAAQKLSLSANYMPSGAGHDSAVVASRKRADGSSIPVGMLFIPNEGQSHSPSEYTTFEAIARGASVMVESAAIYANAYY